MLPSGHRMRRRDEFTLTVRRGRRAGRSNVVVHLLRRDDAPAAPPHPGDAAPGHAPTPLAAAATAVAHGPSEDAAGRTAPGEVEAFKEFTPRVGFIVARTVGNAVVRNRVRRRLRHLVANHIDRLPRGSLLVVRANPAAASARQDQLAADLESALDRLMRPRSEGRT